LDFNGLAIDRRVDNRFVHGREGDDATPLAKFDAGVLEGPLTESAETLLREVERHLEASVIHDESRLTGDPPQFIFYVGEGAFDHGG
jgi:hypothetical protein